MTATQVLPAVPDTPQVSEMERAAAGSWLLVRRAQGGDSQAFAQLYDRYVDDVYRYALARCGSRHLAEDITAETFLRALKRIGSFRWQGRDFGAWLVTITQHLVVDYFRSGWRRFEIPSAGVLGVTGADLAPEGRPEATVLGHLANIQLLSAVKQLNPEQQECIVLRFLQGFTVAETAAAMGKKPGAIKALQYRAVRRLAKRVSR